MDALPRSSWLLTTDEYLAFEECSDVRHEYVGGEIFERACCSVRHACIVGNIAYFLRPVMKAGGGIVVASAVKLQVAESVIYYPDIVLTRDPDDRGPEILRNPALVVEVSSTSTAAIDRREKAMAYRRLPNLLSYVIVYESEPRVDHYWRGAPGDGWHFDVRFDGAITIPGIDLRLTLADIYEGIELGPLPNDAREG